MCRGYIKKGIVAILALCIVFSAWVHASAPVILGSAAQEATPLDLIPHEFSFLGQFGDVRYYFREDRDVLLARDVYERFEWKTGLNAQFPADVDGLIRNAATEEERVRLAEPREQRLNAIWTGMANSLLTVEMYDSLMNISRISSAAREGARSSLMAIDAANGHFRLDVEFYAVDLYIKMQIYLSPTGITYHIYDADITGPGRRYLGRIIITPFLGAVGGARQFFDLESNSWGETKQMPMPEGYFFVPDGSGALIHFRENTMSFNAFTGQVFGPNLAEEALHHNDNASTMDLMHPLMPVFGVNHQESNQAIVAWVTSGAENMDIVMMPHENTTYYNFIHPRFRVNRFIHQIYDRHGNGFFRLLTPTERPNNDITIHYHFLYGENASYAGMARAYRAHLIEEGVLTPGTVPQDGNMPIRLDFIMSDVRRSVMGHTNVVTTTSEQVGDIVQDIMNLGVSSINGGMMGFQRGGVTLGRPWTFNHMRSIGNRRAFTQLLEDMADIGADISFAQDFATINSHQLNLSRHEAAHFSRQGVRNRIALEPFIPVQIVSYARPTSSVDWFNRHRDRAVDMGAQSVTASGITNMLISHHSRRNPVTARESISMIQDAFDNTPVLINAYRPNQYLWAYVDRFLQAPVFNNQFVLFTDTVPFLQLVLHNTMEVYAPYSNFSFYSEHDMLRMIDYNVFPSFVVTYAPAHYLGVTNMLNFYSTEFDIYRDIIMDVYHAVAPVLSRVKGLEWYNRQVLEEGIVLNTYEGGVMVVINYTGYEFNFGGTYVAPLSARVFS